MDDGLTYLIRSNNGVPLFYCRVIGCDTSFTLKKDLERHEKTIHEGGKWYCTYPECRRKPASYGGREDNLKRHIRKQHGVDPPDYYMVWK